MYPSIITEMADMETDEAGVAQSLTLDNDQTYAIANHITSLKPQALYRVMCGFVPEGQKAVIYSLDGAHILRDSSLVAQSDPTGVQSAWRAGRYINLHLSPKGQDGTHYWGFSIDEVTEHHAHISLHHSQNGDPASYSSDVYASLPVDSITGIGEGDTITLSINTFKGIKTWKMKR